MSDEKRTKKKALTTRQDSWHTFTIIFEKIKGNKFYEIDTKELIKAE